MKIVRFEDIDAWQDARELAKQVYSRTRCGDFSKDFGLRDQIQRAAGSAMHSIAEAFGRNHTLDKVNFYCAARGSVTETQSHLEYGKRVGYSGPTLPRKSPRGRGAGLNG